MEHLVPTSPDSRWESITRRDFELTRTEFGTLLAICVFCQVQDGAPVPRDVLEDASRRGLSDIDMKTPGRLHADGLIRLHGHGEDRHYSPTHAGLERVRR